MLHPILGRIPTHFFRQGLPRAAFNGAPMFEQAESPVQPPAADHEADSAHVRRSASKALPRGDGSNQVPINFFSEAVGEPPQTATGKAPTDEQAPTDEHGADSARERRSASKALPRDDVGDQAQLHVPHACARKPAKPPPPRVDVFAIEAEVARGLARLTALSGMAEPQRRKLSCAYCRWDRQPRHTVECCLHKPGCCVCGQAH